MDEATVRLLTDVDFVFLASDTMQSRLIFNALVHQYLIPGAQIGTKVSVEKGSGRIGDIFTATRLVLPYPGAGCLHCHSLISPDRLREEALSAEERRAQRYVDDEQVAGPSVITLNTLSAAQAANDLLFLFTGLYHDDVALVHQMNFLRGRELASIHPPTAQNECLECGDGSRSRRARGDRARLPCRGSG